MNTNLTKTQLAQITKKQNEQKTPFQRLVLKCKVD